MRTKIEERQENPDDQTDKGGPSGPLTGVKVVEFAHLISAPLAGTLLADIGADVVHVEQPGSGDAGRTMGPSLGEVNLHWKVLGRDKRFVSLDLHDERGRYIAMLLVRWADVVIVNMRPATLEGWGLDWRRIHELNKRAVMLQVTGYGAETSRSGEPGFGKGGEAMSGVVTLTGFPDGPPIHAGFSHGDATTGLMGAFAITAALTKARSDPNFEGEWIDLALFESLYRLIDWQVIVHDQLKLVPERRGNSLFAPPAAVVNTYQSSDGGWITVTSATVRSVNNIAGLLGMRTAEYGTREQQQRATEELDSGLRAWVANRTAEQCLKEMRAASVVASKVYTVADIVDDTTYRELGLVARVADSDLGTVSMPAVVPRFKNHPGHIWRTGRSLGTDNRLVLVEWLGVSEETYAELEREGVL